MCPLGNPIDYKYYSPFYSHLQGTVSLDHSYIIHSGQYVAACHVGAMTSAFATLLVNGFVGFQWAEDGTQLSVWVYGLW